VQIRGMEQLSNRQDRNNDNRSILKIVYRENMAKSHLKPKSNPLEVLFSSKEIARDPFRIVHGISVDYKRLIDKRYVVKKLCQILQNPDHPMDSVSTQWRISVVEFIENFFRSPFVNTRDFKSKTADYLNGYEIRRKPVSERIKKARKKKRWSQQELARQLGYKNHVSIAQFEKGLRYPPAKVFRWLDNEKM